MAIKKELNEIKRELKKHEKAHKKIVTPLRIKRDKIEDELSRKENEKLIGKCYKFKNSYGSGDSWWLYYKVLDHIKDDVHELKVLSVQMPNSIHKEVEMKIESAHHGIFLRDTIEITPEVFQKNYKKMLKYFEKEKE